MRTDVSVADALAAVVAGARPLPSERVALVEAPGRTLAADVASPGPLPPFDTSARDGYAVRRADLAALPAVVPLAHTVHAGPGTGGALPPGAVAGVMTGAPLPAGADAVVPVEWTERLDDGRVRVERQPAAEQFVRRAGGALASGAVVARAGEVVTPGSVAALAAVGVGEVEVRRRPRVAVVTTGDEVVAPGVPLGPGQIWDANGPGLAAQVRAAGGVVRGPVHARDDIASIAAALDAAHDADVLVIAGGVSVGEHDHVRPVLTDRGTDWAFYRVRQRPGRPLTFGTLDGRPVLGLPGNPVSAAVCFEVYARPLLTALLGRPAEAIPRPAVLAEPIASPAGLYTFARVTAGPGADGRPRLRSAGAQASHAVRSLHAADGLAHLPADAQEVPAGAEVPFQPWSWSPPLPF